VWEGFTVYPAGISHSGDDLMHGHADDWQADVVLVLYDAFAMDGRIQRQMDQLVMFWQPVDCERMGTPDREQFQISGAQPVAMSRFGARMMKAAGLDPMYAPHGIDTKNVFMPAEYILERPNGEVLYSRESAKAAIREENGLPTDAFLVGINVHNKDADRKAAWEQLSAFALFHQRHPDTMLLFHTMPHPVMSGNNLLGMAEYLGISDVVRWADPYNLLAGNYTPGDMARWYAQLDVYTGASRGEGFGIPLVEAQACSVPVVTTDASAMTELVGPGWLVSGQPFWNKGHNATWTTPDIGELLDAYEDAYNGGAAVRSDRALEFALNYDADLVYETYWAPIWETIEDRLSAVPVGGQR
jgi:glycosyltransferase involved in cell wall biosynthesis